MLDLVLASSLTFALPGLPPLPTLPPITRSPQITYVDRSGAVLAVRGGQFSPPVDLAKLPAYVPAAFIAIEDRRFFEHTGFDPVGIARALATNATEGRPVQGASTITQQLAKNLFLSNDRTLERKTRELLLAVQLERRYSKRQILGLYLSRVYFGSGAWGLEAASRRFFGKPAARLTILEAATLAGVLKSPTGYNPIEQPQRSAARARLVLDAMVQTGAITPAQRAQALARPLQVQRTDPALPAQHFIDWIDLEARRHYGKPREDIVVETTLDLTMETAAVSAARAGLLQARPQGAEQAALVAVDGVGRIRAMVGGADYSKSQFNRAVQARRQAGSAFKPFVYLAALELGHVPDEPVVDEPIEINGWRPQNYSEGYLGPTTLSNALAESINTVAVRLADDVGRDRVAATAQRLGVASRLNTDPAMALGTSQVSPLEMAGAYATLAAGGKRVQPYGLERVRTASGKVLWRRQPPAQAQVVQNPALTQLNLMLRAVIAHGTGGRAAIPGYDLAGKTGTTSDYRDAWFAGYTGNLTTVVWVGRDDNAPMRNVTGGGAPAQLWRAFMVSALPRAGATAIPGGPAPVQILPPAPPLAPLTPVATEPEPLAAEPQAPARSDAFDNILAAEEGGEVRIPAESELPPY